MNASILYRLKDRDDPLPFSCRQPCDTGNAPKVCSHEICIQQRFYSPDIEHFGEGGNSLRSAPRRTRINSEPHPGDTKEILDRLLKDDVRKSLANFAVLYFLRNHRSDVVNGMSFLTKWED